jgi:hypothetical protein
MISSIDFMVIFLFGGVSSFSTYILSIEDRWEFSFDTEDYGYCVGWATILMLNIAFVIY